MKSKVILIALVTAAAVGCRPKNSATTTQTTVTQDTTGFAQYQQWKAQHELASPNQYNPNSLNQTSNNAAYGTSTVPQHRRTTVYSSTSSSSHTARATKKKGWSHGAKDAVIGGVGGAVIGVIADKKNRGAGGVIGGVVGAAAGYGIGHHKDKKERRY
jgi:hypothetical protein